MSVDLTSIIVAVIGLIGLVFGGTGGLIALIRADRAKKKEKAAAKAEGAPREAATVADLVQKLARDALADADDRLDDSREDARVARQDAAQARADAAEARASAERAWAANADARALVEVVTHKYGQALAHIKEHLEPEIRRLGGRVPPWPPDPEPGEPVISHDRRHRDVPYGGPERRRTRHQEDPDAP